MEIIARARLSAKIVFLGTNHPITKIGFCNDANFALQENNLKYNEIIREIAQNNHAILIDHAQYWHENGIDSPKKAQEYLLADGIHLNLQGHQLYTNCILQGNFIDCLK